MAPHFRSICNLFKLLLVGLPALASAQWKSAGALTLPPYSYTFLAPTPNGDLLAATYNAGEGGTGPTDLPAVLIKNPAAGGKPEVVELCRSRFDVQRGYGGIACDQSGAFYVSGDTGDAKTSFLKKFLADGRPDRAFGIDGEIKPGRRCLGVETIGSYLYMAVDWGIIKVYRGSDGQFMGDIPQKASGVYVRDIAVDPKSMRIFGVAQGGVVMWGHGSPWKLDNYKYEVFTPPAGKAISGEGISIDSLHRCVLLVPHPGQRLFEVFGNRTTKKTTIDTAALDAHIADSALSFDGTTLFLSDMTYRTVHIMKRSVELATATTTYATPTADASADEVPAAKWFHSYNEVVEQTRKAGRPMIVYFRIQGAKPCEEFEKNVLRSPAFNKQAQGFVCVMENADKNRLLAYRFGVFRAPHIFVLDEEGEQRGDFSGNIDNAKLFQGMEAVSKRLSK